MKRRVARWAVRGLLALLALVTVLVVVAIIVLQTGWGREQVRAQIEAKLRPYFPAGARVGRVEGNVLGDFVLRDIVLQDLEGRPAVRIERVELNAALLSLPGEVRLEKVIVEGAAVDLHQHDGDPPNLATMFKPSSDPLTFDVVVERLEVRAAAVTLERDGRVEHLDDFIVLARMRMQQDGAMRGRADVTTRWRERATPLALVADLALDAAGVVDIAKAELVAGDVRLEATNVRIGRGNDVQGALRVEAPRGSLDRLAPELGLAPAAIELDAAVVSVGDDGIRAVLRGSLGNATVLGALSGRRSATRASIGGTIMVRGADARDAVPSLPATSVDTTTVVALEIEPSAGRFGIHGTIGVDGRGTVDTLRFDKISAGVTIAGGEARLVGEARGAGDTWVRGAGVVTVRETPSGTIVDLRDGTLVAHSAALDRAAQGHARIAGAIDADLAIEGRILGGGDGADAGPQLAVRGTVEGRRLRRDDVRVGAVAATFALDGVPGRPGGNATVRVQGARMGGDALPDLVATARGRMGGGFAVTAAVDDRARDVRGRIAGDLTLPRRGDAFAAFDIGSFDVETRGAKVAGRGGRIVIGDEQIVVRGVRGTTAGGTFAVDVVAPRARPTAVAGVVSVEQIDLARLRGAVAFPTALQGVVDARLTVERGHARAHLALADDKLGTATGILDVDLPRRPEDPAAWMALDRRAVRELQLDLKALDLAELGRVLELENPVQGRVDGTVRIGTSTPSASLQVRGLMTDGMPAPADVELQLDLSDPALTTLDVTATLGDLAAAHITGSVRAPTRVFDARQWQRLGVGAIEEIRVQVERVVLDERLAARTGVPDLRGVVTADLRAGRALAHVEGTIAVRDLRAGPLVEPASVTLALEGGRDRARGELTATLGSATVVTAELSTPRDLIGLVLAGRDLAGVPVTGELAIADLDLQKFARSFGVRGAPGGKVRGTGRVTGTLGAPVGEANITIDQLGARTPRRGGAPRGGIRELALTARYGGGDVHVAVNGRQDAGGRLEVVADARLADLAAARAHLTATDFELRPLARLLPDVLFGVSGKLSADLRLRGTDPATAAILGTLQIRDGTVPIDDTVGVMRDTTATVTFEPAHVTVKVNGAVEAGKVTVDASAALDGLLPQRGTLTATATGIELITSSAPRVNGTLTADLERAGDVWKVTAEISKASVTSRVTRARQLHPSGMPDDLVFASTAPGAPTPVPPARQVKDFIGAPPTQPFLEIILRVKGVTVDVPLLRGDVGGRVDVAIGDDGAVIDGKLEVQRGDVMVLERRYRLRRAVVSFDGGIDPLLDLQLERELPELTLLANIRGRASEPRLELTSDPPSYTQGQLLAFAISDTASAAGSETTDAAANLFASVASQAIVGVISPILPVHFDVIAYEPASSSSSRAFVFGRWLTRRLLVLYRNRTEARTDENVNEAEVEYWLGRRVLVEGVAGDRGILGADLLWTRRW